MARQVLSVVGSAAVALVDDDEVEEVGRVFAEVGRGLAVFGRTAQEGLEDGEEEAAVLGDLAFAPDVVGFDADQRVFGEGGEGVVGLIGKDVAVGEKEDARAAQGFTAEAPAAVEEFPGDLKSDKGFAGARGEG